MRDLIETLETHMDEAVSKSLGGGKFKYQGKVGVWRTSKFNDRMFIPDDGSPPMAVNKPVAKAIKKKAAKKKGKKKKLSVDATISFQHGGKKVTAKMKGTKWKGGNEMEYTWKTSDGKEIKTTGVPKGYDVVSDPGL